MARSTDEAMKWFLSNSVGGCLCERCDGKAKTCQSFPEAKAFFEEEWG